MSFKNKLEKIKEIFLASEEVVDEKFLDVKTSDGRILRVDSLEVDQSIQEVNEEGVIDIEDGDYTLEDGTLIVVSGGMITEIKEVESEDETTEVTEEDMSEETVEEKFVTTIQKVDKWDITVDKDLIEVGTDLKQVWMNEDGEVSDTWTLGDGEYELEDGRKIQVDTEGIVVMISGDESKEEVEEVEEVNEEMSEETTEVKEEFSKEDKELFDNVKDMLSKFESVKEELDSLKQENEDLKIEVQKFSNEPAIESTKTKIEFNKLTKEDKLKFFGKR